MPSVVVDTDNENSETTESGRVFTSGPRKTVVIEYRDVSGDNREQLSNNSFPTPLITGQYFSPRTSSQNSIISGTDTKPPVKISTRSLDKEVESTPQSSWNFFRTILSFLGGVRIISQNHKPYEADSKRHQDEEEGPVVHREFSSSNDNSVNRVNVKRDAVDVSKIINSRHFPQAHSSSILGDASIAVNISDHMDFQILRLFGFSDQKSNQLVSEYAEFSVQQRSLLVVIVSAFFFSAFCMLSVLAPLRLGKHQTNHPTMVVVFGFSALVTNVIDTILIWILVYRQTRHCMKSSRWGPTIIRKFTPIIQFITLLSLSLGYCFRLLGRVLAGACSADEHLTMLDEWNCNPNANVGSLPMDTLIGMMFLPVAYPAVFRECRMDSLLIAVVLIIGTMLVGVYLLGSMKPLIYVALTIFLCVFVALDSVRQSWRAFIAHKQLEQAVAENQRMAQQTEVEMRHVLGNVAHDFKTPLSSFMHGIDVISQAIDDYQGVLKKQQHILEQHRSSQTQSHNLGNTDQTQADMVQVLITPESRKALTNCMQTIQNTVHDVHGTNSFMLMTINRCLDFTKVSKGMKLTPKFETIDLLDTIAMPINCMKHIQQKITVKLLDIPKDICSHLITDKQWLQENVLCLLSNAVKYSSEGQVTISLKLETFENVYSEEHVALPDGGVVDCMEKNKSAATEASSQYGFLSRWFSFNLQSDNVKKSWPMNFRRLCTTNKLVAKVVPVVATSAPVYHSPAPLTSVPSNTSLVAPSSNYLVFEVEDEGIGIPDQRMNQLFAPFKQTQRLAGGTGLGLFSLAKRIEAMQGNYGVKKRKDGKKGSLFWFAVPYRPDVMFANLHQQQIQRAKRRQRGGKPDVTSPTIGRSSSHDDYCASVKCCSNSGSRLISPTSGSGKQNMKTSHTNSLTDIPRMFNIPGASLSLSMSSSSANSSSSSLATLVTPAVDGLLIETYPSSHSSDARRLDNGDQSLDILLVEDSPMISKMVTMMLSRNHHQVVVAENGEIAIKRVMTRLQFTKLPFDVILMDLQMPVMDGLEATKRLREIEQQQPFQHENGAKAHLRIIGLSANSDSDTMQEAYDAGIDCFIPKPFNIASFNSALTTLDVQHNGLVGQSLHASGL